MDLLFFPILFLMLISSCISQVSDKQTQELCFSPQFLQLGYKGMIECSVSQNLYALSWYNSTNYFNTDPIIFFSESKKQGNGYQSGEYDISVNGSLIINEVRLTHEHYFTVSVLYSGISKPIVNRVRVVVTRKPSPSFPVISSCGNKRRICYTRGNESYLNCSVEDVKPPVNLTWLIVSQQGPMEFPSENFQSYRNKGYSSWIVANLISDLLPDLPLNLFVCKAESAPGVLTARESLVVVENIKTLLPTLQPIEKQIQVGERLVLPCFNKEMMILVWKWKGADETEFQDLCFSLSFEETYTELYREDLTVDKTGSLVIPEVQIKQEGFYGCISVAGFTDRTKLYNVTAYVMSDITVGGCHQEQQCSLHVENEGTLECAVRGIRPRINLVWETVNKDEAVYISFTSNRVTVEKIGNTFDVMLTSQYEINNYPHAALNIRCKGFVSNVAEFNLTRRVALMFKKGNDKEPTAANATFSKNSLAKWLIIVIIPFFVICTGIVCVMVIHKTRGNSEAGENPNKNTGEEEVLSLQLEEMAPLSVTENDGRQDEERIDTRPKGSEAEMKPGKTTLKHETRRKNNQRAHLDQSSNTIDSVDNLDSSNKGKYRKHNLSMGAQTEGDVLLYEETVHKSHSFCNWQIHIFEYCCRNDSESITCVLVKDGRNDNTGGNPKKLEGGPGERTVKVRVTSRFHHGLDVSFYVYGRISENSPGHS